MQRFEFSDGKSNKFWEVEVTGCTLKVRYGRIGTSGQESNKTFGDPAMAAKERDKLIKEKTGKGYQLVGEALSTAAPPATADCAPLSPMEWETLTEILEDMAESFSEHSCNDYFMPDTAANRALLRAVKAFDEARGDETLDEAAADAERLYVWDDHLMRYFADRCGKLAKGESEGALALNAGELLALVDLLLNLAKNEFNQFDEDSEDFDFLPSEESKALVIAAVRHVKPEGMAEILRAANKADDSLSTYSLWLVAYLAKRCHDLATVPEMTPRKKDRKPEEKAAAPSGPENDGLPHGAVCGCSGINPKWLKRMKTWHKGSIKEWYKTMMPIVINDLEHYAKYGLASYVKDKSVAPYGQFISGPSRLGTYASLLLFELEAKGVTEGVFDTGVAVRLYSAQHLYALATLYSTEYSDTRFPFDAFGVILGCGKQAFQALRARIRAKRILTSKYSDLNFYIRPIEALMEVLVSDYLQEECCTQTKGAVLEDPVLSGLFARWKYPDPQSIAAECLAICDYHTHGESFNPDEFVYLPVEILLVFKLRQLLGLENPQLDHPLMNTPLGKLPEETPFGTDELIGRVRARMIREGFDETVPLGDDDWSGLRKLGAICSRNEPDRAIELERQALAIAEQADPCGLRAFNGLRSLAALHNIKGLKTESAGFYERALAISRQNPDCDASLLYEDLATLYCDLGRAADAEALSQKYGFSFTWVPKPEVVKAEEEIPEHVLARQYRKERREREMARQAMQSADVANPGETVPAGPIKEMEAGLLTFLKFGYPSAQVSTAEPEENSLSVRLLVLTDAERDKLKADKVLTLRLASVARNKCQEAAKSFFGFVIESQESNSQSTF